jgi:membrane fusion protein (multidrug efflux system)
MRRNIIVLTTILTGITLVSCAPKDEQKSEEVVYLPLVKLEQAHKQTFVHKIEVQGNVETDKDVLLNAEMGGLITQINVKAGDKVNAGQVIAVLDGAMLSSNAEEIKTQLDYAEYMLAKQEELKKRGVGSEFDYKTALNQVNSLKSRLNSLNVQRGKMQIKAPFTGTIDKVFGKVGQMAGPQAPLARLVNNNQVDITTEISEKHFSKIKIGTEMDVHFPNFRDTNIVLKVTQIGNYIEPTNRTFRVMSTIQNNKDLLPNMLAKISITDLNVPNATVIPSKAVMKSQDNKDFVYVATSKGSKEFTVKKVYVKVLEKYNDEAMIAHNSGINEGTLIVVEGAKGITEKDIVRSK